MARPRKNPVEEVKPQEQEPACCRTAGTRTVVRDEETKRRLIHRLSRLEGQVRGIRGMIERDAYCTDVLIQASAASAALRAFEKNLLEAHVRGCVVEGIRENREEVLDDLIETLTKMIR